TQPIVALSIEVGKVEEAPASPEALACGTDTALDAALAFGVPWGTGDDGEATASVGVGEKAIIEARSDAGSILQNDCLHVVEHVGIGDTAEELEGSVHASEECTRCLTQAEPQEEIARV